MIVDRRKRPRAPGLVDVFRFHPRPWEVWSDLEEWERTLGNDVTMRDIERYGMTAWDAEQLGMTNEEARAYGERLLLEWRKLKAAG